MEIFMKYIQLLTLRQRQIYQQIENLSLEKMEYHNNINPISKLSSFIKKYPNKDLHEQFSLLEESFPSHRIVKGDGNCFYRAFAFLYLASSNCDNYTKLFPKAEWSYRKNNSYIQSDQQFQSQLHSIWNKYLRQLSGVSQAQKQMKLQALFNQMQNFDQLMIGYFKSMNYQHLLAEKKAFSSFVRNQADFQKQLERVVTFGQESEGIEIYSLAHAMKTKIIVFYVDQHSFTPIQYMQNMEDKGLYLFYRPGHYDIVYPYEVSSLTEQRKSQQNAQRIQNISKKDSNQQSIPNRNNADNSPQQLQHKKKENSWQNYKTSFRNKGTAFAIQQKYFRSAPAASNQQNKSSISGQGHNPTQTQSKIPSQRMSSQKKFISPKDQKNSWQQSKVDESSKSIYFKSYDYSSSGKYDYRYKQMNGLDETKSSIDNVNREQKSSKVASPPVIMQSWTEPFQRVSIELMGVGALALLCYSFYWYIHS